MRRLFVIAFLALLVLFTSATGYYAVVVFEARRDTPAIVAAALGSNQMTLELEDLTSLQLEILLQVQDPAFFKHRGVDLQTPGAGWTTTPSR